MLPFDMAGVSVTNIDKSLDFKQMAFRGLQNVQIFV